MEPDLSADLERVKAIGERFRQDLLNGRYPEITETIRGLVPREAECRPPNEAKLRGMG